MVVVTIGLGWPIMSGSKLNTYLRRTNDIFFVYEGEKELPIRGYSDARSLRA